MNIKAKYYGQSSVCLEYENCTIYIDPYFSNSVKEKYGAEYQRLLPVQIDPNKITDANYVLITHDHLDHCDAYTLKAIFKNSPMVKFIGPKIVIDKLRTEGIDDAKLLIASENNWKKLSPNINLIAVPAAHPEIVRDQDNNSAYLGYVLEVDGVRLLHSGDTSVNQEIIQSILKHGKIHTAFLPVNENNFFKNRMGIIGNMSVREALDFAEELGLKQLIPIHWDMFYLNEALVEEINLLYLRKNPNFKLLIKPKLINLSDVDISIVIRTLNEERYLSQLLNAINDQKIENYKFEIVIVDSGSQDKTLKIAKSFNCAILKIKKDEFSYGRSLNIGCEFSNGNYLVFISGHCIPKDDKWLINLIDPLINSKADYTYGMQLGGKFTHFSEKQIFNKYFPNTEENKQKKYFCNNANAAIKYNVWNKYLFNEYLTGLEDIDLGNRILKKNKIIKYIPKAAIYHFHHENWRQVKNRFEREAIALKIIFPYINFGIRNLFNFFFIAIYQDLKYALLLGKFYKNCVSIIKYRWFQYFGTFVGINKKINSINFDKKRYFYPE